MSKQAPQDVARYFFQSLMKNQCGICWQLFSDKTQKEFIAWTLKDLYAQNPKAAEAAKLGPPEIKLIFETNNIDLIFRFWRRFVQQSNAVWFHRYGYYNLQSDSGRQAIVAVRLDYENGKEDNVTLTMINERGGWKFGYLESGLPF